MWLAIQAGATCIVSENTWMHRELMILNVDYFIIDRDRRLIFKNKDTLLANKEYGQKIYQPFWEWLTIL